jgi:catechol 2,3-dioxygenase-like lactoylglutathione lyase family enzyme
MTQSSGMTSIMPFFIVRDVAPSIAFYRDVLGFNLVHMSPDKQPFFAILQRGEGDHA